MTIIRIARKEKSFTTIDNEVVNDQRIMSKYFGVYARLIGKAEGWEISAAGMAKLYPTEGREYYTNAFKHLVKLGYIVKIPQPRDKGRFTSPIMELHEHSQLDKPLTDDQVEYLFQKNEFDPEEIQKIYPKRVSRIGSADSAKDAQQIKDKQIKEEQQQYKKAATASFQKDEESQPTYQPPKDPGPLIDLMSDKAKAALRLVGLDESMIGDLAKYKFSSQEIEAAAQHAAKSKNTKSVGWFVQCIRQAWYKEKPAKAQDLTNREYAINTLEKMVSKPQGVVIEVSKYVLTIHIQGFQSIDISFSDPQFIKKMNAKLASLNVVISET